MLSSNCFAERHSPVDHLLFSSFVSDTTFNLFPSNHTPAAAAPAHRDDSPCRPRAKPSKRSAGAPWHSPSCMLIRENLEAGVRRFGQLTVALPCQSGTYTRVLRKHSLDLPLSLDCHTAAAGTVKIDTNSHGQGLTPSPSGELYHLLCLLEGCTCMILFSLYPPYLPA